MVKRRWHAGSFHAVAVLLAIACYVVPAVAVDWFGAPIPSDIETAPSDLEFGHFDQDELLDAVYIDGLHDTIRVYYGTMDGHFVPAWTWGGTTCSVGVGDVDGDGDDDIVGGCWSKVRTFFNPGDGSVPWSTTFLTEQQIDGQNLFVGDIDEDGYADAVLSGGGTHEGEQDPLGGFHILWGSESGLALPGQFFPLNFQGGCSAQVRAAECGDVTGDGLLDLVVSASRVSVNCTPEFPIGLKVFRQTSARVFSPSPQWVGYRSQGNPNCYRFDLGDVDGDEDLDIVAAVGALYRFRNNSLGLFQAVGTPILEPGGYDVACGYVDADECEDVVWSYASYTTICRGTAEFDLPQVQYEAYGSDHPILADAISGAGVDLLAAGPVGLFELAVWPGLLVPTDVSGGIYEVEDHGLRVAPAVSNGEAIKIELSGGTSSVDRTLGVFDVHGREVTRVMLTNPRDGTSAGFWDGRDRRGSAVPAGVYWIRGETERGLASARVIFVR